MKWFTALDPAVSAAEVAATVTRAHDEGADGVIVPPNKLHAVVNAQAAHRLRVISTAGWPTGNHHPLVKASEARLAVQCGAEIVLAMADQSGDESAIVGEIALLREAVPAPAELWVCVAAHRGQLSVGEVAAAVRRVGVDGVIVSVAPASTPNNVDDGGFGAVGVDGYLAEAEGVVREL